VDPNRPSLGATARANQLAEAITPDRHFRSRRESGIQVVGGERAHGEKRHLGEAAADLSRLRPGRHGQARRAARQGGVRAGVGAMAVTVCLDHGAQLRALGELRAQPGAVALDRADVDSGKRPCHC